MSKRVKVSVDIYVRVPNECSLEQAANRVSKQITDLAIHSDENAKVEAWVVTGTQIEQVDNEEDEQKPS